MPSAADTSVLTWIPSVYCLARRIPAPQAYAIARVSLLQSALGAYRGISIALTGTHDWSGSMRVHPALQPIAEPKLFLWPAESIDRMWAIEPLSKCFVSGWPFFKLYRLKMNERDVQDRAHLHLNFPTGSTRETPQYPGVLSSRSKFTGAALRLLVRNNCASCCMSDPDESVHLGRQAGGQRHDTSTYK